MDGWDLSTASSTCERAKKIRDWRRLFRKYNPFPLTDYTRWCSSAISSLGRAAVLVAC